jgi:hypothetical protein
MRNLSEGIAIFNIILSYILVIGLLSFYKHTYAFKYFIPSYVFSCLLKIDF